MDHQHITSWIERLDYEHDSPYSYETTLNRIIDERVEEALVKDRQINVRIRVFRPQAVLPKRGTDLAAGFDLYANIPVYTYVEGEEVFRIQNVTTKQFETGQFVRASGSIEIEPGGRFAVPTGLNVRLPADAEMQIRSRSGLAFKNGVVVLNAPGTIDADYDGDGADFELKVILVNLGTAPFVVKDGDRIAQAVFSKVAPVSIIEDTEENRHRNVSNRNGGFGHTGVSRA